MRIFIFNTGKTIEIDDDSKEAKAIAEGLRKAAILLKQHIRLGQMLPRLRRKYRELGWVAITPTSEIIWAADYYQLHQKLIEAGYQQAECPSDSLKPYKLMLCVA
jgi:hypothetical protein